MPATRAAARGGIRVDTDAPGARPPLGVTLEVRPPLLSAGECLTVAVG